MSVGMVVNPHLVLKYTNMYVKWALNHFFFLEWRFSNRIVLLRARCQHVFDIIREMEEHYTLWGLQRTHYVSENYSALCKWLICIGLQEQQAWHITVDIYMLIFPPCNWKKNIPARLKPASYWSVLCCENKRVFMFRAMVTVSHYDTARRKRVRVSLVKHFKNNLSLCIQYKVCRKWFSTSSPWK